MAASHHQVSNLIALIDLNGIQNDDFTQKTLNTNSLAEKYRAFGWQVRDGIDGHDLTSVREAFVWAQSIATEGPVALQFNTVKGKGVSFMENNPAFHGAPPDDDQFEQALMELS